MGRVDQTTVITHMEAGERCKCTKLECGGVESPFVYCPEHGIDAGPSVPTHQHVVRRARRGW